MFDEIKRYDLTIHDKFKTCELILKDKDDKELNYKLQFDHEIKTFLIYRLVDGKYKWVRLENYKKYKSLFYLFRLLRFKL